MTASISFYALRQCLGHQGQVQRSWMVLKHWGTLGLRRTRNKLGTEETERWIESKTKRASAEDTGGCEWAGCTV